MNRKYTEKQLIEAVKKCKSKSAVCRELGISPKGGNLRTIGNKIKELNLDTSHFTGMLWSKGMTYKDHPSIRRKTDEEYFIKGPLKTSNSVRLRLLNSGLREYKCERCGRTEWEGEKIPLELHHINGDHWDNRLENLQILCPNCHALTDNYSGRKNKSLESDTKQTENKKKKEKKQHFCKICGKPTSRADRCKECAHKQNRTCDWPDRDTLKNLIRTESFLKIGKMFSVSNNAVVKWCKYYQLPYKKKDIKSVSDQDWENI